MVASQSFFKSYTNAFKLLLFVVHQASIQNTMSLPQCCNRKLRPYTFRDEREKQIIVKTELCRKIQEGLPCEFGDRCNFAHSEEEIQLKTLQERHDAGLIDKETYCTRPCLDYVATGDWYV